MALRHKDRRVVRRQPGGSYNLVDGFHLLGIGPTAGYKLIGQGHLEIIELPGGIKRIPDREIARLLGETPAAQSQP
jgi:hypothetical protein